MRLRASSLSLHSLNIQQPLVQDWKTWDHIFACTITYSHFNPYDLTTNGNLIPLCHGDKLEGADRRHSRLVMSNHTVCLRLGRRIESRTIASSISWWFWEVGGEENAMRRLVKFPGKALIDWLIWRVTHSHFWPYDTCAAVRGDDLAREINNYS